MSATEQGLALTAREDSRPTIEYPSELEVAQLRERSLQAVAALEPLPVAIERFNETFNYDLRLPIDAKTLESAALIAEFRGRPLIANSLRAGLAQAMEVVK